MADLIRLLNDPDELDALIAGSADRPVLVFKHSLTCGTSAFAYEEIEALVAGAPLPVDVVIVHVQTGRAVSAAIAQRLGVRHESPQVLLIVAGRVVWQASHHRVTKDTVTAAFEQYLPASSPV